MAGQEIVIEQTLQLGSSGYEFGSRWAILGFDRRPCMRAFTRITVDPNLMGGVPCLRALRIPVATVVSMVSEGMNEAEILKANPDLEHEDIREALRNLL
jgi:uncharacterized protein (DUF433 family)